MELFQLIDLELILDSSDEKLFHQFYKMNIAVTDLPKEA